MFWTNIAIDILLFFFVIDCLLMCLVVLMQKSKQEGLGASFGGGFMSDIVGTGTSAFLVKTTCILAAGFFIISISLAKLYSVRASVLEKGSPLQQELMKPVAPAPTPANATPMTAAPAVAPAPASTNATPMTAAPSLSPASTNAAAPAAPATPADK